jgi:hypothetical protein
MNGVVAAQTVKLGEFACGSRQGVVDTNHAKLGAAGESCPLCSCWRESLGWSMCRAGSVRNDARIAPDSGFIQ